MPGQRKEGKREDWSSAILAEGEGECERKEGRSMRGHGQARLLAEFIAVIRPSRRPESRDLDEKRQVRW
jgi:hypothetical protein